MKERIVDQLLFYAVANNLPESVSGWIKLGANPNAHSISGCHYSPLSEAMLRNDETIVRLLLSLGADANFQDSHGRTVLMLAVSQRDDFAIDVIRQLLMAGCDIGLTDKQGLTIFDYCTESQAEKLDELLDVIHEQLLMQAEIASSTQIQLEKLGF